MKKYNLSWALPNCGVVRSADLATSLLHYPRDVVY